MRKITAIIMIIVTLILVGWDMFVYFGNDIPNDTISGIAQSIGSNWAIPFAFGFIFIGHFFWPGKPIIKQPLAFTVVAVPWTIILILGIIGVLPPIAAMIPAIIGIISGRLFWPQSKNG